MQFIETALALALPVQRWTPLTVILPSVVTLPLNASKGDENDSAQVFCVTFSVMPMSDGSQCAVMSQSPLRSGQLPLPALLLPPLLPVLVPSDEHALHTKPNTPSTNHFRDMAR